jgi:hypothetical protein
VSTVKLAAKLADDKQDRNGLEAIADDILADHTGRWIVAAIIEPVRITEEIAKGGVKTPTVRVVHIEPMLGDNTEAVRALINGAYESRTGRTPLPLDELATAAGDGKDAELLDDGPSSPAPDEWLDNGKGGK